MEWSLFCRLTKTKRPEVIRLRGSAAFGIIRYAPEGLCPFGPNGVAVDGAWIVAGRFGCRVEKRPTNTEPPLSRVPSGEEENGTEWLINLRI